MKLLTLEWKPRITTQGMSSATTSEHCTIGPYKSYIGSNDKLNKYLFPYVLFISCRAEGAKITTHATIEEAKQTAVKELTENIHKMCTELGYQLPE